MTASYQNLYDFQYERALNRTLAVLNGVLEKHKQLIEATEESEEYQEKFGEHDDVQIDGKSVDLFGGYLSIDFGVDKDLSTILKHIIHEASAGLELKKEDDTEFVLGLDGVIEEQREARRETEYFVPKKEMCENLTSQIQILVKHCQKDKMLEDMARANQEVAEAIHSLPYRD